MRLPLRCVLLLSLALLSTIAGPVWASDINDLQPLYSGEWWSRNHTSPEFLDLTMSVNAAHPDGTFDGSMGEVPIHGKVTPTGAVTFSGKTVGGSPTLKIKSGKAQLSATGLFFLGSLTYNAGSSSLSGKYSFRFFSGSTLRGLQEGPTTSAATLLNLYKGGYHDNANASREGVTKYFSVTSHQAHGKFTGEFDGVTVHGKVTSQGKVTFNGTHGSGDSTLKVKGDGFLSANGTALIGKVTYAGRGTFSDLSGKGTFDLFPQS